MTLRTPNQPSVNFYPRSLRGERRTCIISSACGSFYFYPHSPGGERLKIKLIPILCSDISIHAPRAGSDRANETPSSDNKHFYPRSPCGERLSHDSPSFAHGFDFNPRSPCGERRRRSVDGRQRRRYFNPRSPCGERQKGRFAEFTRYPFQSTLPVRGATSASRYPQCPARFQSTLPVRGATMAVNMALFDMPFQSTLPVRGATRCFSRVQRVIISIHAPRAGSDECADIHRIRREYFNPRSPGGERRGVFPAYSA